MTGASTPPSAKEAVQTPSATVRSRASRNIVRMSDRVEGMSVAPAMPSSARAAMSIAALVAKAASTEAHPKAAPPASSSRRRPMRSPSAPMVISAPPRRNA